ncbi:hypothetical protein [Cyanobium sp. WKJ7-Wakatipu]|uniref:hypothetical protein n=1 Tax=Cyanobium sp. WKJ7-Wakatipu TaxID=2823726 RepID=UPI0020CF7C82|nr:hypothetical protein [Cyanobium sp. WKJ7-Wakatipu]
MHGKTRYPLLATAALLLLLASGCIRKISGVYKDANNVMSLDFQPDGRVYSRIMGVPVVSNYEESGSKIIFKGPEGDAFVDIVDANTLSIDHPLAEYTGRIELKKQQ